ncbi:dTDP-glucose 4,6-dehydratase [Agrococcus sediminis]|uniref:dTDP-glucose 4,6-dehydratase n=1 Tax=Agrococcus sediminis TaxID=2599924 RepID=A0A5M8Q6X6_9MICO|nr:dTDP-glucose 4,6-dehydratase [Agrococcus sediminis]KAA6430858.1 dTDP-glucose 4,6-dehydratase [Agrococcus sediminis]
MKILVTGGAGFIGSNLVRMALTDRLPGLEGAAVTVLDALTYSGTLSNLAAVAEHPRFAFVQGDIRDTGLLDRLLPGVDAIVHVAGESHLDRAARDSSVFVETNVVGTQRLLDAALRHGVRRIVHVSTDEVLGSIEEGSWSEDAPVDPSTPYAASKAGGELLVRSYHRTHGLDVRIARLSSSFGPHHFPEKLIPMLITNLLDGIPAPLAGDGGHVRDWLHVDDHCRGIALVLTAGRPGETYHLGGGAEVSNRRLAELVVEATGSDWSMVEPTADERGHDRRASLASAKARDELGFAPQVPFEQGLADVVQWYREHRSWWQPLKERVAL